LSDTRTNYFKDYFGRDMILIRHLQHWDELLSDICGIGSGYRCILGVEASSLARYGILVRQED